MRRLYFVVREVNSLDVRKTRLQRHHLTRVFSLPWLFPLASVEGVEDFHVLAVQRRPEVAREIPAAQREFTLQCRDRLQQDFSDILYIFQFQKPNMGLLWLNDSPLCEVIDSGLVGSGRGTARAENAQGTPTQSHISPSVLVHEEQPLDRRHARPQDPNGSWHEWARSRC